MHRFSPHTVTALSSAIHSFSAGVFVYNSDIKIRRFCLNTYNYDFSNKPRRTKPFLDAKRSKTIPNDDC